MIDTIEMMKEAQRSLLSAWDEIRWKTTASEMLLTHYTGEGGGWRVELVVVNDGARPDRMGTAVRDNLVLKLTSEQAHAAERCAKNAVEMNAPCGICGQPLRHQRHWPGSREDFCPFMEKR